MRLVPVYRVFGILTVGTVIALASTEARERAVVVAKGEEGAAVPAASRGFAVGSETATKGQLQGVPSPAPSQGVNVRPARPIWDECDDETGTCSRQVYNSYCDR
ncbi:MAG: hypothetical protein ACP5NF_12000, partial [Thermoanaerobaculum sp.]